jgi:hypothetical protein
LIAIVFIFLQHVASVLFEDVGHKEYPCRDDDLCFEGVPDVLGVFADVELFRTEATQGYDFAQPLLCSELAYTLGHGDPPLLLRLFLCANQHIRVVLAEIDAWVGEDVALILSQWAFTKSASSLQK